jgi:hypothetical protein
VHRATEKEAHTVLAAVRARLAQCRLQVHPQKTKIVYCKDSNRRGQGAEESFDFLGFTFRPRRARNRDGQYFVSFSPAISRRAAKEIRATMRRNWRIRRRTDKRLIDLARMFNPEIRGWIQYYGSFHRSALYPVFRSLDLHSSNGRCASSSDYAAISVERAAGSLGLRSETRSCSLTGTCFRGRQRLGDRSRMSREAHVRFWESPGVRSPGLLNYRT